MDISFDDKIECVDPPNCGPTAVLTHTDVNAIKSAVNSKQDQTVFYNQEASPGVAVTNSLWFQPSTKALFIYDGTQWVQIARLVANTSELDDDAGLGDSADWFNLVNVPTGIFKIFYQTTAPSTGFSTGDYWIDSDDNVFHRYSGSSWLIIQDTDIQAALTAAADAQATADGKVMIYAQDAAPTDDPAGTLTIGDLWIDTNDSNKQYRWDGDEWISVRDAGIAAAISAAADAQGVADAAADAIAAAEQDIIDANGLISTLQTELAEMQNLPVFDEDEDYAENDMVQYDGSLYRALQAMTNPSPDPTDEDYWELIGDYASIGAIVAEHSGLITAMSEDILSLETDVGLIDGRVTVNETAISTNAGNITLKANQTTVSTLSGRVTTAEGAIVVNAGNIALKASQTDVTTLTGRVTTAEGAITTNAGNIALKASQSEVDTISGDVTLLTGEMELAASQWTIKLTDNGYVAGIGQILYPQWSASTAYTIGDHVYNDGVVYESILGGTNHEPPNGTYWEVVPNGTRSEMVILTDKFKIISPSESGVTKAPFIVGNIGGVSTIGIDGNMVIDGTVVFRNLNADVTGKMFSTTSKPYADLSGSPTSLSAINSTEGTKLGTIQSYATANTPGNLVFNGSGEMESNVNWPTSFVYDETTAYVGKGCFKITEASASRFSTALIPVSINRQYEITGAFKSTLADTKAYVGFACYDAQDRHITPVVSMHKLNTDTTLYANYVAGSTTCDIYPSTADWYAVANSYILFKTSVDGSDLPNFKIARISNIDKTPGTYWRLTLYSGGYGASLPAGTSVCNSLSGSTYGYALIVGTAVGTSWNYKSAIISGVNGINTQATATQFRIGTKYIKYFICMNYNQADTSYVDHCTITEITPKLEGIEAGADVTSTHTANNVSYVGTRTATQVNDATVNFTSRNDRLATAVTAPTIPGSGTAIDHVNNTDGTSDISFEWLWAGTEADIDGFMIYVYASTSSSAYTFGTTEAEESVFFALPTKRAFVFRGFPANKYYTFGVQAYRIVDPDVNATGFIKSTIVKSAVSGENPYRPESEVAFSGTINSTITWSQVTASTGRPADDAQVNAPSIGIKKNYGSFSGANNGEAYIHGFDGTGAAADVNGFIQFNGAKLSLTKGLVCTQWANTNGYIIADTDGTAFVTDGSTQRKYAFAKKVNGAWTYDDNLGGSTSFTPDDSMVVIGTISTSTADLITTAEVWGYGMSPAVVPEAGATVGAPTGTYVGATLSETVESNASSALSNAATANNLLADIASDSKLTASEKQQTKLEWDGIVEEKPELEAQATALGITTEKTTYTGAYDTLSAYITPLLSSLTTTSDITGTTFRANFAAYYEKRQLLLNKIVTVVNQAASTAQGAANAAQGDANTALGALDDIAADIKITPVEKLEAKQRWDAIVVEGTPTTGTIPVQATALGVADTDFDTDYAALNTYLNTTLAVFSNMTTTTTIVRSTWDTTWRNYYDERTKLLNAIAAKAATLATWAGVSGTGKPADNATVGAPSGSYVGSTLAQTVESNASSALSNAATAQSTANGKIVSFFQTSAPTATATGDLWFDTDDSNKPYRWSGSAWVAANITDLRVINSAQAETLVLTDTQGIRDTFNDTLTILNARWPTISGTGETSKGTGGTAGDGTYVIGNNSGTDTRRIELNRNIPYDPSKLHKIRIRVRRTLGTGTIYLGVRGYLADGVTFDDTHQVVSAYAPINTDFVELTGYFKGNSASGTSGNYPFPATPGNLKTTAKYFRPYIIVNHDTAGTTIIDEFTLEIIPEEIGLWGSASDITKIEGGNIYVGSNIVLNEGGSMVLGNYNIIAETSGVHPQLLICPDGGTDENDYCALTDGDIRFYYYNTTTSAHQLYSSIKRIASGVAEHGETVTLPGIWKEQPSIMLSPADLETFNVTYVAYSQKQTLSYTALTRSGLTYTFDVNAFLELSGGSGMVTLNNVYTDTDAAFNTGWADFTTTAINPLPSLTRRLIVNVQAYGCTGYPVDVYELEKDGDYLYTETHWWQGQFNVKLEYYTNGAWATITQAAPVVSGSEPKVPLNFQFDTGTIATDITQYRIVYDHVSSDYALETSPSYPDLPDVPPNGTDTPYAYNYVTREDVLGTWQYLKEVSYVYSTGNVQVVAQGTVNWLAIGR